jgi:hypothetical protein
MRLRAPGSLLLLCAPCCLLWTTAASALSAAEAEQRAITEVSQSEQQAAEARERAGRPAREEWGVSQMLLANRSYERAIDYLCQVIELGRQGKAKRAAIADAEALLGEAYYRDGQLLSARRQFSHLLSESADEAYGSHAAGALTRLVDVGVRTGRRDVLDEAIGYLSHLADPTPDGANRYAKGKALLAVGRIGEAISSLQEVPPTGSWYPQSQYLLGVALMRQAIEAGGGWTDNRVPLEAAAGKGYSEAMAQFERTANLPATTAEHRQVVDLAWMAVGRMSFESHDYTKAIAAYEHIGRDSKQFADMLYELAWANVKVFDFERAERALDVLSVTRKEALSLADDGLLRGDLQLRTSHFDKALKQYEGELAKFEPLRKTLADYLEANPDPTLYYDQLVADDLELKDINSLPSQIIDWARASAADDRAFAVIDDVAESHRLIKDSRRLAERLTVVLASPVRVKAFGDIKENLEFTLGALNRLSQARAVIARGLDAADEEDSNPEVREARRQRRELAPRVVDAPITPGDFLRRAASAEGKWGEASQQLHRLLIEMERLRSMINALRRVTADPKAFGLDASSPAFERYKIELAANEQDLELYRARIEGLRREAELGKLSVGLGDQQTLDDDALREQFEQALSREVTLVSGGAGTSDGREYAQRVQPLLARAVRAQSMLLAVREQLERRAQERADEVMSVVRAESAKVEAYAGRLDALDQEARLLIGEVAMQNFQKVRDRISEIVMRADVGLVQQAWEVRQQELEHVGALQRERSKEEKLLNDELEEVVDEEADQ